MSGAQGAAAVLPDSARGRNKNKLKKTIKSVLCPPDAEPWPALNEKQSDELTSLISKYKVPLPDSQRPPWSVLKLIPKEQRPKSSQPKVPGLIFGLSQVARLLKSGECNGVILDVSINPRILVRHIIEAAIESKTFIVCMTDLKKVTFTYFGIQSCCLALTKSDGYEDVKLKIAELSKIILPHVENIEKIEICNEGESAQSQKLETISNRKVEDDKPVTYLYRTSKDYRVFVPPSNNTTEDHTTEFRGQNYIKFSKNSKEDSFQKSLYKGMVLKRVSSNSNRKRKI